MKMRFDIAALRIFLLLCIFLECSAYNLVVDEGDVAFIVSPVVNVLGSKNSSTSPAQLPSYVEPSYFGYSFDLYINGNGTFGLMTGSPKRVDPTNPAVQNPRITPWQDPKGSVESCEFSASLFSGHPASCQPAYPPHPKLGDSFGLVVAVRKDGATMACSPTRKQDCGAVSHSPGTCYRSSDFGKNWNSNQTRSRPECPETTMDVLFVLDGSGSVFGHFGTVKRWVKNIVKQLRSQMRQGYIKVGVVQYSHYFESKPWSEQKYVKTEIEIGQFRLFSDFSKAMDKITHQNYTTYTGRALEKVVGDFNSTPTFGRKNNKQMMFLMTDGKSSDPKLVPKNAAALRRMGVTTFAVGVGKADTDELRTIATGNKKSNDRVYSVKGFDQLDSLVKKLKTNILKFVLEGGGSSQNATYKLEQAQTGFSSAFEEKTVGYLQCRVCWYD